MSRAEAYRRAHHLMYRPDDVFVWETFAHARYWATDRYGFIDLGAANIRAAWPTGDITGRWKLATSKAAQRVGEAGNMDVPDRLLGRLAAVENWTPLQVTEWACTHHDVHQRLLVRRHDRRPVTFNSEWLIRLLNAFPNGLLFEQAVDAIPGKVSEGNTIRVSALTTCQSANYTSYDVARVVAYLMPSKVPLPQLPDVDLTDLTKASAVTYL